MIQGVIFDCFGVLLTDALSTVVADVRQKDPAKAQRIVDIVKAANRGMIDPLESRQIVASELGLSLDEYVTVVRGGEARNRELLAYIKTLRPNYRLALLSNIGRGGLDVRFPNNELLEYFDVVVASGEIGYAKPEAQAYEITADRLGVRLDQCVMIDDRQEYCEGAIGVGMQAILFDSTDQLVRELDSLLAETP